MKYHIFLNGFSSDLEKQAIQINGFVKCCLSCNHFLEGKTIIICKKNSNLDNLKKYAITKNIVLLPFDKYNPENIIKECEKFVDEDSINVYGFDKFSVENAVRMAVRKNGTSIINVKDLLIDNKKIFVKKLVYSNYVEAQFKLEKPPYFITINKDSFELNDFSKNYDSFEILETKNDCNDILEYKVEKFELKETLEDANFIIVAGRGVKNKENVLKIQNFANRINAKLGISRPVAMSAWADMGKLIGVSGTSVKPKMCITLGVSGSAAFYSGIEKSDYIISINTDEKAPIIKKSDISIIDDFEAVITELEKVLNM